jgi:hypothetical protein
MFIVCPSLQLAQLSDSMNVQDTEESQRPSRPVCICAFNSRASPGRTDTATSQRRALPRMAASLRVVFPSASSAVQVISSSHKSFAHPQCRPFPAPLATTSFHPTLMLPGDTSRPYIGWRQPLNPGCIMPLHSTVHTQERHFAR